MGDMEHTPSRRARKSESYYRTHSYGGHSWSTHRGEPHDDYFRDSNSGRSGNGDSSQAPRRDYYAILKVPRDATFKQIKRAYHRAAKAWHPDKNRGPGKEARLEKAERNMRLLSRAYEVLSDSATRAAYDRGDNVDAKPFGPG